jgi:hypothetical protein
MTFTRQQRRPPHVKLYRQSHRQFKRRPAPRTATDEGVMGDFAGSHRELEVIRPIWKKSYGWSIPQRHNHGILDGLVGYD